jgi:hypothetical protein
MHAIDQYTSACGVTLREHFFKSLFQTGACWTIGPTGFAPLQKPDPLLQALCQPVFERGQALRGSRT